MRKVCSSNSCRQFLCSLVSYWRKYWRNYGRKDVFRKTLGPETGLSGSNKFRFKLFSRLSLIEKF